MGADAQLAIIVVDVQNDFVAGGVLAAPDSADLPDQISAFLAAAKEYAPTIVFTRDWHPANHLSFKSNGGPWPPHCVTESHGAQLHDHLIVPDGSLVINKGTDREVAGYSAFRETELEKELRALDVKHLAVCGLVLEHCVSATAADGTALGFNSVVVDDLVRSLTAEAWSEFSGLSMSSSQILERLVDGRQLS